MENTYTRESDVMDFTEEVYPHSTSCALALLSLKLFRDSISLLLTGQLNMGSAGQLTWRPNFGWCQKVLRLPCSFFLLRKWQNNSLVPPLSCHKPAPCLQPSQWPAHMHRLAFSWVRGTQVYQAISMSAISMSAQKQTQCWGQNRSCSHGSCPYTPGWQVHTHFLQVWARARGSRNIPEPSAGISCPRYFCAAPSRNLLDSAIHREAEQTQQQSY